METKQHIKEFTIVDGKLEIESPSGNHYTITKTTCSCKGFGFRRTCSHLKEAEERGLISLLNEPKHISSQHTLSPEAHTIRKNALKQFLIKNNITTTEDMINTIEPQIPRDSKPEDIIALAKICKYFVG